MSYCQSGSENPCSIKNVRTPARYTFIVVIETVLGRCEMKYISTCSDGHRCRSKLWNQGAEPP